MKTAVKPFLWAGVASLALTMPSWAETTVLDLANKQNAERAAVTAQAQPAAPAAPSPAVPVINSPAVAAPAPQTAAAVPPTPVPPPPTPALTPPPGVAADAANGKSLVTLDSATGTATDKDVPPQVQAVADKLRGAKVDLSLEDMNQARAALARLDLLLELEQKMHDLQEARQKHSSASGADISGYLPPQVAAMGKRPPPPVPAVLTETEAPTPAPTPSKRSKPKPAPSQYEVQRVMGINGSYSAVLKSVADIKTKTVKVGDVLSDGSEVAAISPTAVTLRDPDTGKTQAITIENVSALSGGRGAH